jgi:hypothetical protein
LLYLCFRLTFHLVVWHYFTLHFRHSTY